jgi:hypothetical protein
MMHARLYDSPQEFAEMMIRHLSESLNVSVQQSEEEPLLLEISLEENKGNEKVQVSLHSTLETYMASGDLNTAIDYLNSIIYCTEGIRANIDITKLDPLFIYPAIRDIRYIKEAGKDSSILSEEYLPGLGVIFLEIKDKFSKIINQALLDQHPQLTEDKIKALAYQNLCYQGWSYPNLNLKSPFRHSCQVEVFMDKAYPPECQFLLPQLSRNNMPESCLIAFTNRKTTLLLRSDERMGTMSEAYFLAHKSRFKDVVERSCRIMPHPVSERIYWVHKGEARLLEEA